MKGYRAAPMGERHIIVDADSFGKEYKSTENLENNELKMTLLLTTDCPINTKCICLEYGVSSICSHLGVYPTIWNNKKTFGESVQCRYDEKIESFDAKTLRIEHCPEGKDLCIGCDNLKDIQVRSDPLKSHSYVICDYK
jgi:hypothetical protein